MDPSKFSVHMSEMIQKGLDTPFEDYHNALTIQINLTKTLDAKMHRSCDILVDTSANQEAPLENDMGIKQDHNLIYTMCHTPTIGLPMFMGEEGLPIGVQFIARRFDDYKLFYFAKFVEDHLLK